MNAKSSVGQKKQSLRHYQIIVVAFQRSSSDCTSFGFAYLFEESIEKQREWRVQSDALFTPRATYANKVTEIIISLWRESKLGDHSEFARGEANGVTTAN